MSDELRDRIARVIHREECACGEDVTEEWEERWAQAIIDEFGMQVEECPCVFDCKETRIVGKWEKQ